MLNNTDYFYFNIFHLRIRQTRQQEVLPKFYQKRRDFMLVRYSLFLQNLL
jgi:hypothetical protein